MCLAYPGKVIKIPKDKKETWIDFGKIRQKVNIELVENLKKGDWVNVHAGFAIQKLTQKDAFETLRFFVNDHEKTFSKNFKRNKSFSKKNKK